MAALFGVSSSSSCSTPVNILLNPLEEKIREKALASFSSSTNLFEGVECLNVGLSKKEVCIFKALPVINTLKGLVFARCPIKGSAFKMPLFQRVILYKTLLFYLYTKLLEVGVNKHKTEESECVYRKIQELHEFFTRIQKDEQERYALVKMHSKRELAERTTVSDLLGYLSEISGDFLRKNTPTRTDPEWDAPFSFDETCRLRSPEDVRNCYEWLLGFGSILFSSVQICCSMIEDTAPGSSFESFVAHFTSVRDAITKSTETTYPHIAAFSKLSYWFYQIIPPLNEVKRLERSFPEYTESEPLSALSIIKALLSEYMRHSFATVQQAHYEYVSHAFALNPPFNVGEKAIDFIDQLTKRSLIERIFPEDELSLIEKTLFRGKKFPRVLREFNPPFIDVLRRVKKTCLILLKGKREIYDPIELYKMGSDLLDAFSRVGHFFSDTALEVHYTVKDREFSEKEADFIDQLRQNFEEIDRHLEEIYTGCIVPLFVAIYAATAISVKEDDLPYTHLELDPLRMLFARFPLKGCDKESSIESEIICRSDRTISDASSISTPQSPTLSPSSLHSAPHSEAAEGGGRIETESSSIPVPLSPTLYPNIAEDGGDCEYSLDRTVRDKIEITHSTPFRKIESLLIRLGFVLSRTNGSHVIFTYPKNRKIVVIPKRDSRFSSLAHAISTQIEEIISTDE